MVHPSLLLNIARGLSVSVCAVVCRVASASSVSATALSPSLARAGPSSSELALGESQCARRVSHPPRRAMSLLATRTLPFNYSPDTQITALLHVITCLFACLLFVVLLRVILYTSHGRLSRAASYINSLHIFCICSCSAHCQCDLPLPCRDFINLINALLSFGRCSQSLYSC